jgi:hypothetical protein
LLDPVITATLSLSSTTGPPTESVVVPYHTQFG